MLPLFFGMSFNDKIKYYLEKILEEKPNIFLIDIHFRRDNSIKIIIDSDNGIKVKDCIEISKAIKNKISQGNENFSVEVSSPGVGENLKISRQYINNIGRDLEIKLDDGTFVDGKLKNANQEKIELEILVNNLKNKRGKTSRIEKESYNYTQIKQARVKLEY